MPDDVAVMVPGRDTAPTIDRYGCGVVDQRPAILRVAAAALSVLLDQGDPDPVLRSAPLADLARLEYALRQLFPAVRSVMVAVEEGLALQTAADVPRVGPAAVCGEPVVNHVIAYVRDSRGGTHVAWSTNSCPAHLIAHIARTRYALTPVTDGDTEGDTSVVVLPLSLAQNARCGDYRSRLYEPGS
jgi:hypothetical protein